MQYSIVELKKTVDGRRLDAEYYRPSYISIEELLISKGAETLGDYAESILSFGAYSLCNEVEYVEAGTPFLRGKDIKGGQVDFSNVLYIDSPSNELLWKSEVFPETLLITMSGTVGECAIADPNWQYPVNSNQDIAKIRVKNINPYYLFVFLLSKYGDYQFKRLPIGSVQQHIFLWQMATIMIVKLSDDFQSFVEKLYKKSVDLHSSQKSMYKNAQKSLLSELGLVDWQPKHTLSYVRQYSEVEGAERIDAEHFQPKYDEILEAIKQGDHKPLGKVVSYSKGIEVGSGAYEEEGIPFIRVSDVSYKGIDRFEKRISPELYETLDAKYTPHKGDLLMTKDGTIGITFVVDETTPGVLSGAFLKLKPKIKIETEYLALVLNSVIGAQQIDKIAGGAIIAHLKPSDAEQIVIPLLSEDKQKQIAEKAIEAKEARKKSQLLLEIAKQGVEKAIEDDEATAEQWMKQELDALGVVLGD